MTETLTAAVAAWLAWGTRQVAGGLRCIADAIEGVAAGIDGAPASFAAASHELGGELADLERERYGGYEAQEGDAVYETGASRGLREPRDASGPHPARVPPAPFAGSSGAPASLEDDSRPLAGTRERIASTLDRARRHYEDAVAGTPGGKDRRKP